MPFSHSDNKHIPIPPAEFEKRCRKIFGEDWINQVAYNLKRTPSHIRRIRRGIASTTVELKLVIEGWERGVIPVRRCPPAKIGRPKAEKDDM